MPPEPLPPDRYAKHIVSRLTDAHKKFNQVKTDLRQCQRDVYDTKAHYLPIPDGKVVYMHKIPSHKEGIVSRFTRSFYGPYLVTGHSFKRPDMLSWKHIATGETIPHPVNIEKVVVIPDPEVHDLQASNDSVVEIQLDNPAPTPVVVVSSHSDLVQVAYQFGKFLQSLPSKSATASQGCKFVYEHFPSSHEILSRHGRLRGLCKVCPYLQLEGAASCGTYILSLNQTLSHQVSQT